MSTDDFVHLHVASSASMRYGASHPAELVARAAALGQPALALTDRDELYGAVRFARACGEAGVAPVLGVDLALDLDHEHPTAPGRVALSGEAALAGRGGGAGTGGHGASPGTARCARSTYASPSFTTSKLRSACSTAAGSRSP